MVLSPIGGNMAALLCLEALKALFWNLIFQSSECLKKTKESKKSLSRKSHAWNQGQILPSANSFLKKSSKNAKLYPGSTVFMLSQKSRKLMVYIGTFRSASYVVAKSKYSHHIRPNHLSMIQQAKTHNLLLQSSVMMAIEGSGHMCGSGLYELLVERDPSRGGFKPWKQMGWRKRRKPSSWEGPAGSLLMHEWITNVWRSLMSECSTLCLIDYFHIDLRWSTYT